MKYAVVLQEGITDGFWLFDDFDAAVEKFDTQPMSEDGTLDLLEGTFHREGGALVSTGKSIKCLAHEPGE